MDEIPTLDSTVDEFGGNEKNAPSLCVPLEDVFWPYEVVLYPTPSNTAIWLGDSLNLPQE